MANFKGKLTLCAYLKNIVSGIPFEKPFRMLFEMTRSHIILFANIKVDDV